MMVSKTAVILSPSVDNNETPTTQFLDQFYSLLEACRFNVKLSKNLLEEYFLSSSVPLIICIDMDNLASNDLLEDVINRVISSSRQYIILINAPQKGVSEKQILMQGLKGVFYASDRRDIILRGIEAISNGKTWFKRATLDEVLSDLMSVNHAASHNNLGISSNSSARDSILTKREWMIVRLVAKGAQNIEIAEQLNISVNTVKTHIYSIFRKTKCRNRVELITWLQMGKVTA